MTIETLLGLLNDRFTGFHTLWSFYISVSGALLAYVASTFTTAAASGVRIILIVAFAMFAAVNANALLDVRDQRENLASLANIRVASDLGAGLIKEPEAVVLRQFISKGEPHSFVRVLTFHVVSDLLVILVVWYVPGALARTKRALALSQTPVVPRNRRYLDPALISRDEPGNVWILGKNFPITTSMGTLIIPEGFRFDLASIPRAFWWLLAPFELSVAAPLVHDYLYSHAGKPSVPVSLSNESLPPPIRKSLSRADVDLLFLEIMKDEGVSFWRRYPAYAAVRVFGELSWAS